MMAAEANKDKPKKSRKRQTPTSPDAAAKEGLQDPKDPPDAPAAATTTDCIDPEPPSVNQIFAREEVELFSEEEYEFDGKLPSNVPAKKSPMKKKSPIVSKKSPIMATTTSRSGRKKA